MTPDLHPHKAHHLPAVLVCLLVAFGCGDASYTLDPGHIEPVPAEQVQACFEGARAELTRFSTECAKSSAKSLSAEVQDGAEFTPEMVSSLDSPCADGPSPGIEVLIEHNALIFDFARVQHGGRFPDADFDGYVIDLSLTSRNALLIGAAIDRVHTTLPLTADDIAFERDHIEINLEGIAYEPGSMLEIDLLFANIPAVPEDA